MVSVFSWTRYILTCSWFWDEIIKSQPINSYFLFVLCKCYHSSIWNSYSIGLIFSSVLIKIIDIYVLGLLYYNIMMRDKLYLLYFQNHALLTNTNMCLAIFGSRSYLARTPLISLWLFVFHPFSPFYSSFYSTP